MNLRLIIMFLVLLGTGSVSAQNEDTLPPGAVPERSIPAARSAEAFRPVGEYRVWRFFAKQTTFGQLSSVVKGRTEIDGQEALILQEDLQIDYSKIGTERQVLASGESYLSNGARYLGSKLRIGEADEEERFEIERSGRTLEGFYTRAGTEHAVSVPYENEYFFWDVNFVDQLEYFLAMHDLSIGTRIEDSIYLPQSLMTARIVGQVVYFMHKEIYKSKFDSVFVIRLTEPSDYQLYLTPDKRLVRVDLINQDIRVYQDIVGKSAAASRTQTSRPVTWRSFLFKLPHYGAFVIVAGLAVLFFSTGAFRRPVSYLFFAGGAGLYLVVPLVLNPLLVMLMENWLRPAIVKGSSIYLLGIGPSLIFGLAQVGLMLGIIYAMLIWSNSREYRFIGLGAFLGAGFGLAEAIYVAGLQVTLLFDWPLVERTSFIFLHTISGALIAWGLAKGAGRLRLTLALVLVVNVVARYLPLLVQGGLAGVEATHFVLSVGMLLYLLAVLMIVKKVSKKGHGSDMAQARVD